MKKFIPFMVVTIVAAGLAFYGGMIYGKNQSVNNSGLGNLTAEQRQARFLGDGNFPSRAGGIVSNGGMVAGEILSKDDDTITVKLRDGGSKIVFYSASTQTTKSVEGTVQDLVIGQEVTVMGSANQDGSVSAQSIQIRPAAASATSTAPQL